MDTDPNDPFFHSDLPSPHDDASDVHALVRTDGRRPSHIWSSGALGGLSDQRHDDVLGARDEVAESGELESVRRRQRQSEAEGEGEASARAPLPLRLSRWTVVLRNHPSTATDVTGPSRLWDSASVVAGYTATEQPARRRRPGLESIFDAVGRVNRSAQALAESASSQRPRHTRALASVSGAEWDALKNDMYRRDKLVIRRYDASYEALISAAHSGLHRSLLALSPSQSKETDTIADDASYIIEYAFKAHALSVLHRQVKAEALRSGAGGASSSSTGMASGRPTAVSVRGGMDLERKEQKKVDQSVLSGSVSSVDEHYSLYQSGVTS